MQAKLSNLLQYKNQRVMEYFCFHSQYSPHEAAVLFEDLLAWMWLADYRQQLGKKTHLFGPLLVLDEIWHCFILHTRDYLAFSLEFFGEYFHHETELPGFEHSLQEAELNDFLKDCFTFLGQPWIERRFSQAFA